jgi:hypothetical protein
LSTLDFPPEIAAAIERAESVERKAAIFGIVVSAVESKSRAAKLEAALIASVLINVALVATIIGLLN